MSIISKISTLALASFLLFSCGPSKPSDILPPKKMEAFLYDYHIAKAFGDDEDYSKRYTKEFYLDYTFKKHNITKEEFDRSLTWYTRHVTEMKAIYENVSKRLSDDKAEVDQLAAWHYDTPLTTAPGDTVDIWAWHREYRLTGTPLNNTVIFSLPVDSNFVEKDSIHWSINFDFNKPESLDSLSFAVMQLALYFKNDSSMIHTETIKASGIQSIGLKSDSTWSIKSVNGFVYFPPQPKETRVLLDSITMYRYHPVEVLDSLTMATDSIPE